MLKIFFLIYDHIILVARVEIKENNFWMDLNHEISDKNEK